MNAFLLSPRAIERPWGRSPLPGGYAGLAPADRRIGEIWFEGPASALLVKRLFTSERLSIQVHPDDAHAHAAGHPCGKDEAWIVTSAEPGAVIGIGLKRKVEPEALRAAAEDGSIVDLLDWRPVRRGTVLFAPAGTIHAIGGGIELIEIQQNCDITYRLYDYGRPRELHLEQGLAVASPAPLAASASESGIGPGRDVLAHGRAFVLERWQNAAGMVRGSASRPVTLVMADDASGSLGTEAVLPDQVWMVTGDIPVAARGTVYAAYPGSSIAPGLIAA